MVVPNNEVAVTSSFAAFSNCKVTCEFSDVLNGFPLSYNNWNIIGFLFINSEGFQGAGPVFSQEATSAGEVSSSLTAFKYAFAIPPKETKSPPGTYVWLDSSLLNVAIFVLTVIISFKIGCVGVVNVSTAVGPDSISSPFKSDILSVYSVPPCKPSEPSTENIIASVSGEGIVGSGAGNGLVTTPFWIVICIEFGPIDT